MPTLAPSDPALARSITELASEWPESYQRIRNAILAIGVKPVRMVGNAKLYDEVAQGLIRERIDQTVEKRRLSRRDNGSESA